MYYLILIKSSLDRILVNFIHFLYTFYISHQSLFLKLYLLIFFCN
jgi:hypothetical protein